MLVSKPWLTLRWLRPPKDMLIPDIVECSSLSGAAGLYYSPRPEAEVNGRCFDASRGLIVVADTDWYAADNTASTLAHEWRHHWQYMNGVVFDSKPFDTSLPYRSAIVKFFCSSAVERDALRFEYERHPCETNTERMEWMGLL